MMYRNPLITETITGLGSSGKTHLAYLNYLLIQAVVLFLWWPKGTLSQRLETGDGPDTLLAVVITLGLTLAYYSMRAGAEEILLPGQHSLREWVIATPLSLGRILHGYLWSHIIQILHALMLSSPLLVLGYLVSSGEWPGLTWSLATLLVQATLYRLLGAFMYLTIGHYDTLMYVSLRVVLVLAYIVLAALIPMTSHWAISSSLLGGASAPFAAGATLSGFLGIYIGLCVVFTWGLYLLLARQRQLSSDLMTTKQSETRL